MSLEPILIAGTWSQAKDPKGSFSAVNPATKQTLQESFPVSGRLDIQDAVLAAKGAVSKLRTQGPERIATFLELYASGIE